MKWLLLMFIFLLLVSGCSCPQTFKSDYYEKGFQEAGEDLDDVTGARTL